MATTKATTWAQAAAKPTAGKSEDKSTEPVAVGVKDFRVDNDVEAESVTITFDGTPYLLDMDAATALVTELAEVVGEPEEPAAGE